MKKVAAMSGRRLSLGTDVRLDPWADPWVDPWADPWVDSGVDLWARLWAKLRAGSGNSIGETVSHEDAGTTLSNAK
jgi:hypothetical protein